MKIKSLSGLPENASCLVKEQKPRISSIAFDLATRPSVARFNRAHVEHSSPSCAQEKRCFSNTATRSIASRLATRSSVARFNRVSGFTLLEVMVALAIFAVAAIALTKIAMQYTQATSNAILRTKAQFVAMNEVAMMEINKEWLDGTQSKQITSQGETWQIDKKAQATISPKVQRIELQVSLFNVDQDKVEAGVGHLVFFNHQTES
ncbi:type II secretion system minor pseudopilin GspI [Acinetobacter haemolyticus]|nr:type II secretion system minor pseudopilin GspI [Acinetobacter haemolyticus]ATZ67215.1 type II secretion system protein GspI [Acinetobacter haemolyticus]NAR18137.1 type II secretion system minor pseudopilin GspI [Acinetobacter haemolyticus]NAR29276.1 type II secretion system minor pseudopilin GspI [Acinetobacter haemolyticus]NAR34873.1 type II secretion system minor pseudopilin GspI [Acinetobacter haemolyticus]NAR46587.1 type II secretion system minor pseudopilin GspI [Acinetobacter haemoly